MNFFRAISTEEYEDLKHLEMFRAGSNSMEGKWFAETFGNAVQWAGLLGYDNGFWIVEINIPKKMVTKLFKIARLDGIGPASYFELNDLENVTEMIFHKVQSK